MMSSRIANVYANNSVESKVINADNKELVVLIYERLIDHLKRGRLELEAGRYGIEEFEKAEIIVKTVRLRPDNLPEEDISFPNFKFEEIANEEWEDSAFKSILERKFLFVFFQYLQGLLSNSKINLLLLFS